MNGTIKRVVKDKGFGFIRDAKGIEYFFHSSAVKNASFDEVVEGRTCTFEDAQGPKGPRAEDVYLERP